MLAVATNLKFHFNGFFCVLLSTFIFVVQNIFSKRLFTQSKLKIMNSVIVDKLSLLFYSGSIAFFLMLPIWFESEGRTVINSLITDPPTWNLLYLFTLSGITHFLQAILAFSILSLVSPITYSIASLCKRIFVITASITYFGDSVNLIQIIGIALTFAGLYLYHLAESDVEKGELEILNQQRRGALPLSIFGSRTSPSKNIPSV
jgi:drug/metabolite transporter (DMT)-like permease